MSAYRPYEDVMEHVMDDEVQQKSEWRGRLASDVLSNNHDDETRLELLLAGLDQAHKEGLMDAAFICDRVAETGDRTAAVLARSIRTLVAKNAAEITSAGPDRHK